MLTPMRRDSRPPHDDPQGPSTAADEAELVERCRAGDRMAFERFYRDHRRAVAANLYRVLGDRSELDDLVQEVFVIAYRGMQRFRGDAKLSTWLYRICINVALGRLRSKSRKPPPILLAEPGREEVATPESSEGAPDRLMERREDVARVYRALEQLAPKKRIVLVLHEIQGLDIKEIAELVEAPQITVRTRLHYARKEFYKIIAAQEIP
jgi:RNA polymerase sigma-70 factor, ECF subfamily